MENCSYNEANELNIISLNCISRQQARTLMLVYHQIQREAPRPRSRAKEMKLRVFISGSVLLWVQIRNLSLELT